jgi:sarcosine oxidase subunit beta
VVNAAGAWAPKIGQMVGLKIPVKPCRRLLFKFKQQETTDFRLGVIYLDEAEAMTERKGMYMRDDGVGFVGAGTHNGTGIWDEPVDPDNFDEGYSHDEVIDFAEKLYEFLPEFGDFEIMDGWAGLYGNVRDCMFIIDKVDKPKGLILCCGFCGEGLSNSAGAGKMATELILDGKISLVTDPSGYAYNDIRFPELKEL